MSVVAARPWSKRGTDWRHRTEHGQLGGVSTGGSISACASEKGDLFHNIEEASTNIKVLV